MIDLQFLLFLPVVCLTHVEARLGDLLALTDSQRQPQTLLFGNPRRPACASVRTVRRDQAESVGK
jgi:hypothetical protein